MAGQEHLDLLLEAYGIYSHTNPLHTDVWPSMRQLESDVIAMTASMLGGSPPNLAHPKPAWHIMPPCHCCLIVVSTLSLPQQLSCVRVDVHPCTPPHPSRCIICHPCVMNVSLLSHRCCNSFRDYHIDSSYFFLHHFQICIWHHGVTYVDARLRPLPNTVSTEELSGL